MKVIARHNHWVEGAKISESVSEDGWTRRFTATIDGWTGWRVWEGRPADTLDYVDVVKARVEHIRDRIRVGDEDVFHEKEPWFEKVSEGHCTCNLGWYEHVCPYQEDVNNDPNAICTCCPYHTRQCMDDI